jgi:hypothetical protein
MAAKQVPAFLGIGLAVVGIPLILMDARGTHQQIAALESNETRQARCMQKVAHLDLVASESEGLCDCIVTQSEKLGAHGPAGSYDERALKPIVDRCYGDYVAHADVQ